MAGIFKLDEILDAREDVARIRENYKRGLRSRNEAAHRLVLRFGYGLSDAFTILDDEAGK